ncbi:hypothetical protein C2I18_10695 [Paenibacillus sp. PK3_47]|uniref:hypothetical protein n=1 Tax=Paenibacillus sp. PK3_47 TaxID=2072642 RepID=UPI00201E6558|nr:hypothetical protein [Paenibacillus sp. PK3_47]UQZ33952.1 hypothetical protein C2I18_10695 [Paenibacillus sp. PK3_47]
MNNFYVLRLLDFFRGGFVKIGVDYELLRTILQVKLTMDGRRTPTVLSGGRNAQKNNEGSPLQVQWLYLIFGLMMIALVFPKDNHMLMMSLLFSVVMFMITTTLISDFSSVMLDLRDKSILFVRPVNRRTLNMAKSIHILIYLITVTLTFTGPSLIFSLFRHGLVFFLVYAAEIVLMDCFILVVTALLYLLILKFFDGEKLKDMINYVQIILSVGVVIGSQLVSRLFNISEWGITFSADWWNFLIAPVWFAAPFDVLIGGARDTRLVVLSILAFVVPLVLLAAYVMLMPAFERSLQKLASQEAAGKDSGRLARRLAGIFCRSSEEGMFFRFTWSMMKNERDFKLKVYPSIGLSLVFPFIFMFNQVWSGDLESMRNSKAYLLIYFCGMLLMTVVQMLRYSASYKGAWIYKAIPLPNESDVYSGMLKAVLLRLMLPLFVLEAAVFVWLFGMRIMPDLAVVLTSLLLYAVICFRTMPRMLPFSEKYEAAKQSEFKGFSFMLLFILGGMGGLHFVFTLFPGGIYICLAVLVIANVWYWRVSFPRTSRRDGKSPALDV